MALFLQQTHAKYGWMRTRRVYWLLPHCFASEASCFRNRRIWGGSLHPWHPLNDPFILSSVKNIIDSLPGTGTGGSYFDTSSESFPAVPFGNLDFNDGNCNTASGQIENYGDANQVTHFVSIFEMCFLYLFSYVAVMLNLLHDKGDWELEKNIILKDSECLF